MRHDYGRYGGDGNSSRLQPLFLGYETFIRGYSVESFDDSECTTATSDGASTSWAEFDRLLGSRLAVANGFRIPPSSACQDWD